MRVRVCVVWPCLCCVVYLLLYACLLAGFLRLFNEHVRVLRLSSHAIV